MKYAIEDHVPMPSKKRNGNLGVDWNGLKPGQSFFVPDLTSIRGRGQVAAATRAKVKIVYEERVESGVSGVRFWRAQ